jgi:hypothetical protein
MISTWFFPRRSARSGPLRVDVCSARGQYGITRPHFFLGCEGHAERHARTPCGGSHGVVARRRGGRALDRRHRDWRSGALTSWPWHGVSDAVAACGDTAGRLAGLSVACRTQIAERGRAGRAVGDCHGCDRVCHSEPGRRWIWDRVGVLGAGGLGAAGQDQFWSTVPR